MNVAFAVIAGLRRVALRQLDHVRVVFDANGRGAALGGRDDRAAVARSEIHQELAGLDLGEVQHLVDERLRRRHPDDVLAGLADGRLEGRCRGLCREPEPVPPCHKLLSPQ